MNADKAWQRWPLLLAGLTVLGLDIALLKEIADDTLRVSAGALLLGVGCVLVGAGIATITQHHAPPARRRREDLDQVDE